MTLSKIVPQQFLHILKANKTIHQSYLNRILPTSFPCHSITIRLQHSKPSETHLKQSLLKNFELPKIAQFRMSLIQQAAPDFSAPAVMPNNSIETLNLNKYKGQYVILLFYPMDFTFVCPTELLGFNEQVEQFQKKNCQVLSISVDSQYSHLAWKSKKISEGGIGSINYPMISDITKDISKSYGVLSPDQSVSFRGLFLIDKEGIIRHSIINDFPLGRSVDEALRMVDALQHYEQHGEVCPVNWSKGKAALKPSAEGISNYLKSTHSNA